ncbi:hypothetical protein Goari_006259 [Gossypium aridum]|uniref:DUF4283 domain-containing protein n=1 Tax=Gossypium aridum TaxID=34290 RepID=A0A7J8XMP3_GOSAI|nr:hypothetical protein [Gossypium aridum]
MGIPAFPTDKKFSINVGKAIGEVVAIDWRERNGGWMELIRLRVKINVLCPLQRVVHLVGRDELLETNNLSFQYESWPRAQIGGPNQNRGFWRNGIEILDKSSPSSEANNKSKTRTREEDEIWTQKGKSRVGDEGSE